MLQLPVLFLQRSQPLRLAHFHPSVLPLPPVQRLRRDPVLAAQFRYRHSCLRLLQDANDLLFVESTLAQDSSFLALGGHSKWEKSHFVWTNFRGAGQLHGEVLHAACTSRGYSDGEVCSNRGRQ